MRIGNPLKSEDAMFRILVLALLVAVPTVLASLIFGRLVAAVVFLVGLGVLGAFALKAYFDSRG